MRCRALHVFLQVDKLFRDYDKDGGGFIDYQEMNKMLRKEIELDESLKVGAQGEIVAKAKNKHGLRSSGGDEASAADKRARTLQGTFLKLEEDRALIDQLALALNKKWARAKDLFTEWDVNGDGEVDRLELQRALGALGICIGSTSRSNDIADALFGAQHARRHRLKPTPANAITKLPRHPRRRHTRSHRKSCHHSTWASCHCTSARLTRQCACPLPTHPEPTRYRRDRRRRLWASRHERISRGSQARRHQQTQSTSRSQPT